MLPASRAGPGRACTAPTTALGGNTHGLRAALVAARVPDADLFARMLSTGPGRAQIAALVTDPAGVTRALVARGAGSSDSRASGGRPGSAVEWTTVAPVDDPGLCRRIADLLDPL